MISTLSFSKYPCSSYSTSYLELKNIAKQLQKNWKKTWETKKLVLWLPLISYKERYFLKYIFNGAGGGRESKAVSWVPAQQYVLLLTWWLFAFPCWFHHCQEGGEHGPAHRWGRWLCCRWEAVTVPRDGNRAPGHQLLQPQTRTYSICRPYS